MIYQLIGLGLLILSFSHKLAPIRVIDLKVVRSLQISFAHPRRSAWFSELWFFGRTTFSIVFLIALIVIQWKLGLSALAVFGVIAGLEKLLKVSVNRARPFSTHSEIRMVQPQKPKDPSFPSGDTFRIWYLALILITASGSNLALGFIAIMLAVLVSLGRMILGVHYFTDVLAGTGLGFLGAGTTIWLWQIFNLL